MHSTSSGTIQNHNSVLEEEQTPAELNLFQLELETV